MKRRFFLKLSAAGAASALWGCSDGGGSAMELSHGPVTSGAASGGGSIVDVLRQLPGRNARSLIVRENDAALTVFDAQGYSYEIEPFGGRVVERGMLGMMVRQFGTLGLGDTQLNNPVAMAFGEDERMYIVDRGNSRVQVFDRDGKHLSHFGGYGTGDAELSYPQDIALGQDGKLYVADTLNHRVQVFTQAGKSVDRFGVLGTRSGELNAPAALAFDPDGLLHVLELGNRRVQVFSTTGRLIRSYGQDMQLAIPRALAVAADGTSFVADMVTAKVHVFSADGQLERSLSPAFDDGATAAPIHLALSPDGDVYITAIPAAA